MNVWKVTFFPMWTPSSCEDFEVPVLEEEGEGDGDGVPAASGCLLFMVFLLMFGFTYGLQTALASRRTLEAGFKELVEL